MRSASKQRRRGAAERLRRRLLEKQRECLLGLESWGLRADGTVGSIRADTLKQIDGALEKMTHGTYGLCEDCGRPIAKARLQALPYASQCLPCKRKEELQASAPWACLCRAHA